MRTLYQIVMTTFFGLISFGSISAQVLPPSNMYLFEFNEISDSVTLFNKPSYLTAFNPQGYNNQPYFINKDEVYFTVQFSDDTTQTDIFGINLATETLTQITATIESEYSPQPIPMAVDNANNSNFLKMFSCLRVERDGISQRIWEFPLNRSNNGQPSLDDIDNVGYYQWIAQNALAIFQIGAPHNLAVVNKISSRKRNITANIGRCFQPMPKGNMAFVHKLGNSWLIKELDPRTNKTTLLTATLPGSEDFAALPDGTLFMGNGSKLFRFNKNRDSGWKEIADLSYYGINNISRLAVKGNRIVVVNQN